jgi:hypothetical protein
MRAEDIIFLARCAMMEFCCAIWGYGHFVRCLNHLKAIVQDCSAFGKTCSLRPSQSRRSMPAGAEREKWLALGMRGRGHGVRRKQEFLDRAESLHAAASGGFRRLTTDGAAAASAGCAGIRRCCGVQEDRQRVQEDICVRACGGVRTDAPVFPDRRRRLRPYGRESDHRRKATFASGTHGLPCVHTDGRASAGRSLGPFGARINPLQRVPTVSEEWPAHPIAWAECRRGRAPARRHGRPRSASAWTGRSLIAVAARRQGRRAGRVHGEDNRACRSDLCDCDHG